MKLLVYPIDNSIEPFELEVEKKTGGVNDYKFNHEKWLYFQYDCSFRPSDFFEDQLEWRRFHGFLITKSIKGKKEVLEVDIKVLEL